LPWQRPFNPSGKRGPDRQPTIKYLPFGENFVKIGTVGPGFSLLKHLF